MAGIKAILFDIDDTLFSTTRFANRARKEAVHAMVTVGLRADEEQVYQELMEVVHEFGSNYAHHYDKLLMRLPWEATEGLNTALVVSAGVVAYHDTKFEGLEPFDDVVPLLRALRGAGIKVGIVTHGWTMKQAEKLIRLRLLPLLDQEAIFISDQIGISKPNPKLYEVAVGALGLKPNEVIYVGDSLEHDISPPHSLGIHTVWARRAARPDQDVAVHAPDHVVDDFVQLAALLKDSFDVPLEDA